MPIRGGYAQEVFIVTSGEMMSLYAADNIKRAIDGFRNSGYASLKGLVFNAKNIENEEKILQNAAKEMCTEICARIPRDKHVQIAENEGKTVIESFPDSPSGSAYKAFAELVAADAPVVSYQFEIKGLKGKALKASN
jgi:nitrogenase iron protein NifH